MYTIGIGHTTREIEALTMGLEEEYTKDDGSSLPVVIEGASTEQISQHRVEIVEGTCARCGYDRLKVTTDNLTGESKTRCNACSALQTNDVEKGYKMTTENLDKKHNEEDIGRFLMQTRGHEVYDLEPSTQKPYISLVSTDGITRVLKTDITEITKHIDT